MIKVPSTNCAAIDAMVPGRSTLRNHAAGDRYTERAAGTAAPFRYAPPVS